MRAISGWLGTLIVTLAAGPASAAFHLWVMNELYSNADGTVQFLELNTSFPSEQFVAGHTLSVTQGATTRTFTVPSNLPGPTNGHSFLFGTQGFAALGVVTPDFIVPNGFFFLGNGTINWADADIWPYSGLPSDGQMSLNRSGGTAVNSPRNFAGQTGTVVLSPPAVNDPPTFTLVGNQTVLENAGAQTVANFITAISPGPADEAAQTVTLSVSGNTNAALFSVAPVFTGGGATRNLTYTPATNVCGSATLTVQAQDNGGTANGGQDTSTQTFVINVTCVTAVVPKYQALWWHSPAGSENGWGVNITHQDDTLFATWFTYDTDGSGLWLVMSNGNKIGATSYSGPLYRTTGSPFSIPFDASRRGVRQVGGMQFDFADLNNGVMSYSVNGVTQSKAITRQVYSSPVAECASGATPGASPNYQDLWWRAPAGSEDGWGVNITHQGDILFATWFTYGSDERGVWFVMSNGDKTASATYTGPLYRTTGPSFDSANFSPTSGLATAVGNATFTFTDSNNGTFAYTVSGVTQSKPITRQVFATPATVCR